MNQHNEHILLKYAQTEQAQRSHAAEAWEAASHGVNSHILKASALGGVALVITLAVVLMGLL